MKQKIKFTITGSYEVDTDAVGYKDSMIANERIVSGQDLTSEDIVKYEQWAFDEGHYGIGDVLIDGNELKMVLEADDDSEYVGKHRMDVPKRIKTDRY